MANIVYVDVPNRPGIREYDDWDLVVSGVQVSVPIYTFKSKSVDRVIDEAWDFSVVDRAEMTHLMAYLVRDTATDDIEVLVDEIIMDGTDTPYRFADGAYDMLEQLWYAKVPPNTADLAAQEIKVFRTVNVGPEE